MNIFKRIYCRIFQGIFKLALPLLPYRNPKIETSIDKIPSVLMENNKNRPLIVTDRQIEKLGLLKPLLDALDTENIKYSMFLDVVPNPTSDNVGEAISVFKKEECDSIIAFGGGSAMDCAKGVGALIARPNKTLKKLGGILKVRKKIPLLIAIPTTCGTGSETTLAAVITDSQTRHKYAINDFPLIPSYAILDVNVIKTLPTSLVATTGLDALTHALEAYIGRSTTKDTRKDALEAIKLIFENIENAALDHDEESLKKMLLASHMAGRAFSKSYVGYVHALAHALGGKYNIPHGYANAVILPHVLKAYGKKIYKKLSIIADYIGLSSNGQSKYKKSTLLLEKLDEIENRLSIDKHIDKIQIKDISEMAAHADKEANPLYPVPVLWDKQKLAGMYYIIKGNE